MEILSQDKLLRADIVKEESPRGILYFRGRVANSYP